MLEKSSMFGMGGRRSINHRDGLISLSDSHERSPSSTRLTRASLIVYGVK